MDKTFEQKLLERIPADFGLLYQGKLLLRFFPTDFNCEKVHFLHNGDDLIDEISFDSQIETNAILLLLTLQKP